MKNINIFLLLLLFTITIIAGCSDEGSAGATSAQQAVRVGIDTAAGGSLQIRAAENEGYFDANGIETEISNFAYGIDTINALLTKQTDTGIAADYALLNSINRGDIVILGTINRGNEKTTRETEVLAVKDVKAVKDIKGKKIGVAKGTVYEYHWAKYLEAVGIDEDEVEYVPYSTPDEALIGMKKGSIDVILTNGALIEKFKSIDGVHQIDDLTTAGVTTSAYLVGSKSFGKNQQQVVNLLKGIEKGVGFVKENPDAVADIAYKELKVKQEDTLQDLKRINYVLGFTAEDLAHLEDMQKWLIENGKLKESYDLKGKLYLDPLREAFPKSVTYE